MINHKTLVSAHAVLQGKRKLANEASKLGIKKEKLEISVKEAFYRQDRIKRCHYCGITEEEFSIAYKNTRIYNENKKGNKLDIQKADPKKEYSHDNCVYICHVCKVAKSDVFNYEEFTALGKTIESLWKIRILKKEVHPGKTKEITVTKKTELSENQLSVILMYIEGKKFATSIRFAEDLERTVNLMLKEKQV